MIEGKVIERPEVTVRGIRERINPMQADYRALWDKFHARQDEICPHTAEETGYGIYFESGVEGLSDFVAGMPVKSGEPPEGLVDVQVPGGEYAVFECGMGEIGPTWGCIFSEWFPSSGRENDPTRPPFEYFRPGVHEGTTPVQIFVPVRKRA